MRGRDQRGQDGVDDRKLTVGHPVAASDRLVDGVDHDDHRRALAEFGEQPPWAGGVLDASDRLAQSRHQVLRGHAAGVDEPGDAAVGGHGVFGQCVDGGNPVMKFRAAQDVEPGQQRGLARPRVPGHHERCRAVVQEPSPGGAQGLVPSLEQPQVVASRRVQALGAGQDVAADVPLSCLPDPVHRLGSQVQAGEPGVPAGVGNEMAGRLAGEEVPGVLPVGGGGVDDPDDAVQGQEVRLHTARGAVVDRGGEGLGEAAGLGLLVRRAATIMPIRPAVCGPRILARNRWASSAASGIAAPE